MEGRGHDLPPGKLVLKTRMPCFATRATGSFSQQSNQSFSPSLCFAGPFYRHTLGNHLVGYRDHPMHSTRRPPTTDLTSSSSSSWRDAFLGSPSPSPPTLISDRPVKRKGEVADDDVDVSGGGNGNSDVGGGNEVNGFQETYTFFKQVAVGKPGRKSFSTENQLR